MNADAFHSHNYHASIHSKEIDARHHEVKFFDSSRTYSEGIYAEPHVPMKRFESPESKNNSIIRLDALVKIIGISRSSVYLRINPKSKYFDPNFPKPIQLGIKAIGWRTSDVNRYIERLC